MDCPGHDLPLVLSEQLLGRLRHRRVLGAAGERFADVEIRRGGRVWAMTAEWGSNKNGAATAGVWVCRPGVLFFKTSGKQAQEQCRGPTMWGGWVEGGSQGCPDERMVQNMERETIVHKKALRKSGRAIRPSHMAHSSTTPGSVRLQQGEKVQKYSQHACNPPTVFEGRNNEQCAVLPRSRQEGCAAAESSTCRSREEHPQLEGPMGPRSPLRTLRGGAFPPPRHDLPCFSSDLGKSGGVMLPTLDRSAHRDINTRS